MVLHDEIEAKQNPAYVATSSVFLQEVDSQATRQSVKQPKQHLQSIVVDVNTLKKTKAVWL